MSSPWKLDSLRVPGSITIFTNCRTSNAWLLFVLFVLLGVRTPSDAQTIGSVDVVVTDSATKEPIAFASVAVFGSVTRSVRTDTAGRATLTSVPFGTYAVSVTRSGYDSLRMRSVELADGTVLTVQMTKPLQRIGASSAISASAASPPPSTMIGDDPRKLFATDVSSLLQELPNLNLIPLANGGASFSQTSDPAQSNVTVDGMHIGPPGTPFDLRSLPLGLFDGASLSASPNENLGGSVDFALPDPTLSSLVSMRSAISGKNVDLSAAARGTAGRVGYAGTVAWSENDGVLQGRTYLDQTGFSYSHQADQRAAGAAIKLRVPLSLTNVLSLTSLASDAPIDESCSLVSNVPCGYGRAARSRDRLTAFGLRDNGTIGSLGFSVNGDVSTIRHLVSFPFDQFLGIPQPFQAEAPVHTQAVSVSVQAPRIGAHTIAANASTVNVSIGSAGPSAPGDVALGAHRLATATISDTVSLGKRNSLQASAETTATDVGSGAGGTLLLSHTVSREQRVTVSYTANRIGFPESQNVGFDSPSGVRYDCADRVAIANGPGTASSVAPHEDDLELRWSKRNASVDASMQAYLRTQRGNPLPTLIGALGIADPAYIDAITTAFTSPLICGAGAAPTTLLSVPVIAGSTTYDGVSGSARWTRSPRVQVIGSAAYTRAFVNAGPPSLQNVFSATFPGAQLPGQPFVIGSLTGAYRATTSIGLIANVHYIGGNDFTGHNGIALVNAAATFTTARGTIVAAGNNLFNDAAGDFSSFTGPVMRTAGRFGLRTLQYPVAPRTITLSYRTSVGRPTTPNDRATDALVGQTDTASSEVLPFPEAAPTDPFEISADNPECGPERAVVARAVFDAVRQLARDGTGGDHAGPFGSLLSLRTVPRRTVLIGSPGHPAVVVALFACARVHAGEPADVRRLGLYIPTKSEADRFDLFFTPRAGVYITGQLTVEEVRVTARPLTVRPAAPFALIASSSCTPDRARAAQPLLDRLRDAFSTEPPSQVPFWTVITHRAARTWYELRPVEPAALPDVEACGDIAQGETADLAAAGIGAASGTVLNYAEGIGLYRGPVGAP